VAAGTGRRCPPEPRPRGKWIPNCPDTRDQRGPLGCGNCFNPHWQKADGGRTLDGSPRPETGPLAKKRRKRIERAAMAGFRLLGRDHDGNHPSRPGQPRSDPPVGPEFVSRRPPDPASARRRGRLPVRRSACWKRPHGSATSSGISTAKGRQERRQRTAVRQLAEQRVQARERISNPLSGRDRKGGASGSPHRLGSRRCLWRSERLLGRCWARRPILAGQATRDHPP
jgi:hypothetical protein